MQTSAFLGFQDGRVLRAPMLVVPAWLSSPESNSTSFSAEVVPVVVSLLGCSSSKSGAGFGCSKRGFPVAGESPTAIALCSTAGLVVPQSRLLLHLGQRMVKGREGIFASSTCSREEHFWQTIIMAISRSELVNIV